MLKINEIKKNLPSIFCLFLYAFSNAVIFTVTLMNLPSSWSNDIPEAKPDMPYYWIAIALTLPIFYINFASGYQEKEAVFSIQNNLPRNSNTLKTIASATIKMAGPTAGIYHLLNKAPVYIDIPLSIISMIGGSYVFFLLYKRSNNIIPSEQQIKNKRLPNYLAFGFSSCDFMIQYMSLLSVGNEFQKGIIHPTKGLWNIGLFILFSICEIFLFWQNFISFKNRVIAMPDFRIKKGFILAHYCAAIVTLPILNIFLILPRQLSNNYFTHLESALIGIIPGITLTPGFYSCVYSFFGNKHLQKGNTIEHAHLALEDTQTEQDNLLPQDIELAGSQNPLQSS